MARIRRKTKKAPGPMPTPRPVGRPRSYKPEYAVQAEKLCRFGATDRDLADFFEVSERTINRWQTQYEEFCRSTYVGKEIADQRVVRSLYHRANGYTYDAVKIFPPRGDGEPVIVPYKEHVPPDTNACSFWLKNRDQENWRDKQSLEHSGPDGSAMQVEHKADESFAAVVRALETVGRTKAGSTSGEGDLAKPSETGAATPT